MILVVRIAGQVKNKKKDNETLKRLKLNKKFTCILVEEDDAVKMGMVNAVAHMVAYGKVEDAFIEELKVAREDDEGVYFLHPPRGGFKKSSKVASPIGILGKHDDIVKLVGRML
ncbi:uL30 family ribosomal protein [Candidatus Pacearchaeota archaeon]|nr:uL30 family ribosomal protein [Candidatus Pacearchaeota archaeon]